MVESRTGKAIAAKVLKSSSNIPPSHLAERKGPALLTASARRSGGRRAGRTFAGLPPPSVTGRYMAARRGDAQERHLPVLHLVNGAITSSGWLTAWRLTSRMTSSCGCRRAGGAAAAHVDHDHALVARHAELPCDLRRERAG